MANMIDGIDLRTNMVGSNRLELLLFRLDGPQIYGINVFKIKEVINCPPLQQIPNSHPYVSGVVTLRDKTISIIDLGKAIGRQPVKDIENSFVIVAEYNRTVQGFVVDSVDHIINTDWEEVLPAPAGAGLDNYLTAITKLDNNLIEIIDVEKVLSIIVGDASESSEELNVAEQSMKKDARILVVDDSSVARKQITRTMTKINVQCEVANDGSEAYQILEKINASGVKVMDYFDMVITDIEMPQMDGYTLTAKIKNNPDMKELYVILHTSLSGVFNQSMVQKVGANAFIAKFDREDLANAVLKRYTKSDEKETA